MSTGDNAHSSSGYYMMTGRPHQPMNFENANPGRPNDSPVFGALAGLARATTEGLPPAITLPHRIFNTDGSVWPGQDAGFLGRARDPWLLNAKLTAEGYRVNEIALPAGLDPIRMERRKSLLDDLRRDLDARENDPFDQNTRRAFDLLLSPRARKAFRLEDEPAGVRERFGASPFGQSVLLAPAGRSGGQACSGQLVSRCRRTPRQPLLGQSYPRIGAIKTVLAPPTDQAFSALLEDLAARSAR